jgi:hypothetical protein
MASTGPAEPGRREVVVASIQKVTDGQYDIHEGADRMLSHVRLNTSQDW